METLSSVATALPTLKRRLEFAYDGQGRRIAKTVKTWNTAWQTQSDVRFLYDGWNLVGEYAAAAGHAPVQLLVWGLDLSGGSQGAGGVGGLLWVTKGSATHIPGYDANGNVVAWVDASNGALAGELDYGAFGEPVLATGVAATQTFGFSTKYQDLESGLLYYGFRYYNPNSGRWLSRDPIEERGGLNPYVIVGNDTVKLSDYLGLWKIERKPTETWATVIAEKEDTIESLARKIGLSASEAEKWLRDRNGKSYKDVNKAIRGGCVSKVPNVAYVTVGNVDGFGVIYILMRANDYKKTATGLGYKVVGNPSASSADIIGYLGKEDAAIWFITAHGDRKVPGGFYDSNDQYVLPNLLEKPHHKLAEVIMYVCYAGAKLNPNPGVSGSVGWRDFISENGKIAITEDYILPLFTGWDELPVSGGK
jgi:RHS repeat-associated protein